MAFLVTTCGYANQDVSRYPRGSCLEFVAKIGLSPLSDIDFLKGIHQFKPDILWLTEETTSTPELPPSNPSSKFPSELFFGKKHDEYDRTAVGLLALKWVLENNYEAFAGVQNDQSRLTRESFDALHAMTLRIAHDPESLDALITLLVINDLGKVDAVRENLKRGIGSDENDHDKVLALALQNRSHYFPSFSGTYQHEMLAGLSADFGLAQFVQAENLPTNLTGLFRLNKTALDLNLLHAIYDTAGAAGHGVANGSVVMNEPTFQNFRAAITSIYKYFDSENPPQWSEFERDWPSRSAYYSYWDYIDARYAAALRGMKLPRKTARAIARIGLLLRSPEAEISEVVLAFNALPKLIQEILIKELNISGIEGEPATFLYYSPALLSNLRSKVKTSGDQNAKILALTTGLTTMARIYQKARGILKSSGGNFVFTLDLRPLAIDSTIRLSDLNFDFSKATRQVNPVKPMVLDASHFQSARLEEIPGEVVIPIGIGGGSDIVQAATLRTLLTKTKKIPAMISVRALRADQKKNLDAEARRKPELLEMIMSGVYKLRRSQQYREHSAGFDRDLQGLFSSGRFYESIVAEDCPIYLVVDEGNSELTAKIEKALADIGGVQTLIAVDTGGDALAKESGQDASVLQALADVSNVEIVTAEIAVGVDAPSDAEQILLRGNARYVELDYSDTVSTLMKYKVWQMDGSNASRYGKTSLAWQAALEGKLGLQVLPLPERVVLDSKNPWDPFIQIQPSMRGIFIMRLADHMESVGLQSLKKDRQEVLALFEGEGDIKLRDIFGMEVFKRSRLTVEDLERLLAARPGVTREHAVLYSAHGSQFRFNSEGTNLTNEPLYTLPEARLRVFDWRGYADTVGGDAIIIHLPSWIGDRSKLPFVTDGSDHLKR